MTVSDWNTIPQDSPLSGEETLSVLAAAERYAEQNRKSLAIQVGKLLEKGKENEAADMICFRFGNTGKWRSSDVLRCFYERFKDPYILYRCIISVYVDDGYNFPKRIMLKAKKIAPSIPEVERFGDLPDGDKITVYRATAAPASKAKNELSWTTNKNVAIWFGYRLSTPLHIYTGTIKRGKIIAYMNERKEYEVIQHGSVKDITEIHPTNEDIQQALKWHTESTIKHNQELLAGPLP